MCEFVVQFPSSLFVVFIMYIFHLFDKFTPKNFIVIFMLLKLRLLSLCIFSGSLLLRVCVGMHTVLLGPHCMSFCKLWLVYGKFQPNMTCAKCFTYG